MLIRGKITLWPTKRIRKLILSTSARNVHSPVENQSRKRNMVPDDGCILKRNHGASPYTFDDGIVGCGYERQQFVFSGNQASCGLSTERLRVLSL